MRGLAFLQQAVAEAERLYASGQYALALEQYRSTVFKRLKQIGDRESSWWGADAIAIERLADLVILEGSLPAAQHLLEGLRDLYLNEKNPFAADYVTIKLSHLALENNEVSDAHLRLQEVTAISGSLESIDLSADGLQAWEATLSWPVTDKDSTCAMLARLYLVMGGILASYGQFRDAMLCLKRGESLACDNNEPSIYQVCAPLRVSIASVCLASGGFASCRAWISRTESMQPLPGPALQIRLYELHSRLAQLEGRYGAALDAFEKALAKSEQAGFARPVAITLLNYAHFLILINQTQRALLHIARAESIAVDDNSLLDRARILHSLAYARRESIADQVAISPSVSEMWSGPARHSASGSNHRDEAIDPLALPRSADFLTFFEDRAIALQWFLSKKRIRAASEQMGILRNTFLACDSPLIHARVKALQGLVGYYRGAYDEAATILAEATEELQSLGLLPEKCQSRRVLIWCLTRLGRPSQEVYQLDAAVQQDLDKLASSMREVDRATYLINKWTATEEYFLGEINILEDLLKRSQTQPWWRRLANRVQIMERLNKLLVSMENHKLDSSSRFLGGDLEDTIKSSRKAPSLWRRLLFQPIRTATVHFLVLPDRVLIIQLVWLRLGFGISAITRSDLRDLVSSWYQAAEKFGTNRNLTASVEKEATLELQRTQEQTLDHLAQALQIQALLGALPRRVKALRIAPDDSLLGFPFAVLKYGGAALPERFSISLLLPRTARNTVGRKRIRNALLVGVSQGCGGVPALPQVGNELDAAQAWALRKGYSVKRLTDSAADKHSVMDELKKTNLLHIACHGIFETDKPGESGFLLVPDAKNSQILSLIELFNLKLDGLEHATLSSCWAADRFILPGRQTIGLPETMLRCGARSVLACLWPVDDIFAARFTARFYEYLERYPRNEALRRTQQDCINSRLPHTREHGLDTSSPVYWAGFNLYGSDSTL